MANNRNLGDLEQLVLLAILRLGDDAYGVSIRAEIRARAGRETTRGALYTTLERLEDKGLLKSRMGDPSPERGGRAKRYYTVSGSGRRAIERSLRAYERMLEGLDIGSARRA